ELESPVSNQFRVNPCPGPWPANLDRGERLLHSSEMESRKIILKILTVCMAALCLSCAAFHFSADREGEELYKKLIGAPEAIQDFFQAEVWNERASNFASWRRVHFTGPEDPRWLAFRKKMIAKH